MTFLYLSKAFYLYLYSIEENGSIRHLDYDDPKLVRLREYAGIELEENYLEDLYDVGFSGDVVPSPEDSEDIEILINWRNIDSDMICLGRKKKKVKMKVIAEKAGLSLSKYQKIEVGGRNVELGALIIICEMLDLKVADVYREKAGIYRNGVEN